MRQLFRQGADAPLPDDALIGMQEWADLEGRARETVRRWWRDAKRRREEGRSLPADMPVQDTMHGNSPRWRMGTYRAWKRAQRPG